VQIVTCKGSVKNSLLKVCTPAYSRPVDVKLHWTETPRRERQIRMKIHLSQDGKQPGCVRWAASPERSAPESPMQHRPPKPTVVQHSEMNISYEPRATPKHVIGPRPDCMRRAAPDINIGTV
jgi:hypothetical protein